MIYFEKTASLMYDVSNEAPSLFQQLITKRGNVLNWLWNKIGH